MSEKLFDHLTYLDDFRGDTSSDTADVNTEGLRAVNFIIQDLKGKNHKWSFTEKETTINYYKDVREYTGPSNYDDMIGLYEQMNFFDPFDRVSPIEFDRIMNRNTTQDLLADDFTGRSLILKINFVNTKSKDTSVITNESYDGNGTWGASGTASNILTDNYTYFTRNGNVRFKVTGSGTATITNSTLTSVDLSALKLNYGLFTKLFVETGSLMTSLELRWGNDASHYHSITKTLQFSGRSFINGLNELGFELDTTSDVGTVDDSAIDYMVLNINHTGSLGKVYFGEVKAITPDPLKFVYYSTDWIYDYSASTWYPKFQNADDTSNDYGAWSGQYDWFSNLINVGGAAIILEEMQEYDRAEKYWVRYQGIPQEKGKGGLVGQAIQALPARVKKKRPPSITIQSNRLSDYFDPDV